MLQITQLRQETELVKERLAVKNFKELQLVDEIVALDDDRKKLNFLFDETKAKINAASKEIGGLMAKGDKVTAEQKKKEVEELKATLSPVQSQLEEAENKLSDMLVRLPNLPASI